jgi:hypothetical protein
VFLPRRERRREQHANGNGFGLTIAMAVALLPTPRASERQQRNSGDGHTALSWLAAHGELLPTPRARDQGTQRDRQSEGRSPTLAQALLPTPVADERPRGLRRGERLMTASDAVTLLSTPQSRDYKGVPADGYNQACLARDVSTLASHQDWGPYAAAVNRWETTLGRPAPPPTDAGRNGQPRLSPRFVEWVMGLPDGWVTTVPAVSRTEQLKALGNGVVPRQCALALTRLTARMPPDAVPPWLPRHPALRLRGVRGRRPVPHHRHRRAVVPATRPRRLDPAGHQWLPWPVLRGSRPPGPVRGRVPRQPGANLGLAPGRDGTEMTRLTDEERALLTYVHGTSCPPAPVAGGPADPSAMARSLADGLRVCLGDVDDLAIGRVLLHLGSTVAAIAGQMDPRGPWGQVPPTVFPLNLATVLALAAADLASAELEFPEASGSA